jgi:putative oxidoreductase
VTQNSASFKRIIAHPYTALILRVVLGAIFIYASWHKILAPEEFARSIVNYRILPGESVNLLAIVLPWIELVCGLLLVLGLFTGGSILLVAFMMTVFLVAIGSALVRGIDISCGCFASDGADRVNILFLIRDIVLFACALQVFLFDRRTASLDKLFFEKVRQ